jgi:Tol biopolymer transport system component
VNGAWTTPVHLPAPINGPGYEYGPSVSPDGRTLYYNSERGGSVGIYRIPVSALAGYR